MKHIDGYEQEEYSKAFEIVREIIKREIQLYSHFYSGDKDTLIEAFNNVMTKYSLPSFYKLTNNDVEKYNNQFGEEISLEFNSLSKIGDNKLNQLNSFSSFIDEREEFYKKLFEGNFDMGITNTMDNLNNDIAISDDDDDDDDDDDKPF